MDLVSGGNSLNNSNLASKQRLHPTHELHERFVDAVAQLGGPDRRRNLDLTSPSHEEQPKGYLFNWTPLSPGQSQRWED
ncbi:hypothetical protein TB1_037274 [Malus domestica]